MSPTPQPETVKGQDRNRLLSRVPEMQEGQLLTGFYGADGKKIKHQVHIGALQLPPEALDRYNANQDDDREGKPIQLPPLDYVKRPSLDGPCVQTVIRHQERIEEFINPLDGTLQRRAVTSTQIQNEVVKKQAPATERIRGGGGDEPPQDPTKVTIESTERASGGVAVPSQGSITQSIASPQPHTETIVETNTASENVAVTEATPAVEATTKPNVGPSSAPSEQATAVISQLIPSTQDVTVVQPVVQPDANLKAPPPAVPNAIPHVPPDATQKPPPSDAISNSHHNGPPNAVQSAPLTAIPITVPPPTVVPVATPNPPPNAIPNAPSNTMPNEIAKPPPNETPIAVPHAPLNSVPKPPPGSIPNVAPNAPPATVPNAIPKPPPSVIPSAPTTDTSNTTANPNPVPGDTKPPASIPSSVTSTQETAAAIEPKVVPLQKRPPSQWEQRSASAEDKLPEPSTKPDWYKKDIASDLEMSLLPEWFDGSANHRTPKTYVEVREKCMEMAVKISRYLTSTLMRRAIPGDSGSLIRLHSFLTSYGLINEHFHNTDAAPTPQISMQSSRDVRKRVLKAVTDQIIAKKARVGDAPPSVDWNAIAATVQNGTTATICEREFLAATTENESNNNVATWPTEELLQMADPKVVSAAVNAALQMSSEVQSSQAAALAGLAVVQADKDARSQEDSVRRIMAEIVDLRMQKLEQRLQILDDVEDMLDSERVALSLERRDLYTARCRHWFGRT